ncbi:hypothetical protein B0I37DRAFT_367334 [Chaetomium sp. MPI-CAGE-AT-0009]|nr:hypothetical protein B0I37DRAFT_367334 [Chaetomium sp. MPI-CAGE-AT-0009]
MAPVETFLANRFPVVAMIASGSSGSELSDWLAQFGEWLAEHWQQFLEWASQPHVIAAALAWVITYCIVCIILLGLGFGPAGVVAGSAAAAFQSYMYGGFTPAAGIFATLTSMGMLGVLVPAVAIIAELVATAVAVTVWICGVGR